MSDLEVWQFGEEEAGGEGVEGGRGDAKGAATISPAHK